MNIAGPSGIHFLSADDCLVTWLRDQLDPLHHSDLESTWIVLPTRRLAANLTASLAASRDVLGAASSFSGSSLITPRIFNLDGFLAAAQANSKANSNVVNLRVLSPETAEALIVAQLSADSPDSSSKLNPSHAHELAHLISTAVDNELPLKAIGPGAVKVLREEIYRSDEQVCALMDRVQSIQGAIDSFVELLKKNSLETMEMRRARLAKSITANSSLTPNPDESTANPAWTRLIIAGFTSMVPAHIEMLRGLARQPGVTVVLTTPPPDTQGTPMARLANWLAPADVTTTNSSHPPIHDATHHIQSWIADTREDEVNLALDLALGLLDAIEGRRVEAPGLPPAASVAILIPDEKTYEPLIRKALNDRAEATGKSGFKSFNLAAPIPLTKTLVGSWFLHMAQFARQPQHECNEDARQTAAAFLTHPLHRYAPQHGGRAAITACLAQAIAASADIKSFGKGLHGLPATDPEIIAAAAAVLDRGLDLAKKMRTKAVLTTLGIELDQISDAQESCAAIARILHDLAFVTHLTPTSPATLLDLFVQRLNSASVRERGEPLTGLQILTLAEARHVPFESAIILGCNEGVFPRALPQDRLLDQFLLRRLGLPTWEDLEAIEDTTFYLLRARLSKIIMTCARRDSTKPLVPSRYIELMKNLHGVKPQQGIASGSATSPQTPTSPAAMPTSGHIMTPSIHAVDQTAKLSASSLASLITCPYKYALDRQAAGQPLDYESSVKMRQGTWLHMAISQALKDFTPGAATTLAQLKARLIEASAKHIPSELRATDIQAHLEHWSWPRLAAFTVHNWGLVPTPIEAFSDLKFNVEFASRQFRGEIDRYENLGSVWLLVDYKTSGSPKRPDIMGGVQPQLAIYAHALTETRGLDLSRCIAGHFEIIKGNWVPGFVGESARDDALALGLIRPRQKILGAEPAIAAAAEMLQWRTQEVAAETPQYLPDHSNCGWCPHNNICRRDDAAAEIYFDNHTQSKKLRARRKAVS